VNNLLSNEVNFVFCQLILVTWWQVKALLKQVHSAIGEDLQHTNSNLFEVFVLEPGAKVVRSVANLDFSFGPF
jgi:hypothetical protein